MGYATKIDSPQKVNLKDFDPDDHDGLEREQAEADAEKLGKELADLEELMYAAGQHSLLIVLQGIDTSGKDGTIRAFLDHLNGRLASVASFKVPTPEEAGHDFLWRVHAKTPVRGSTAIFNRSHYEDVVVVRVHDLVPKETWKARYDQINQFEELLVSANTIVLKFFLHISKEEQEQRLMDREKDTEKAWKLSVGDWKEREHWKDYREAYEDAIGKCASKDAPWFIVPANHKWFRNVAVLDAVVKALGPYKGVWEKHLQDVGARAKAELKAYREMAK